MPALAWSETDNDSRVMPVDTGEPKSGGGSAYTAARPALNFDRTARPRPENKDPVIPWSRVPAVVVIGTAVAVLLVGIAVAIGFSSGGNKPATTPEPGVSTSPVSSAPATQPAQSTATPPPSTTNAPPPAPAPPQPR